MSNYLIVSLLTSSLAFSSPNCPPHADNARAASRPRNVITEPAESLFEASSAPSFALSTVSSTVFSAWLESCCTLTDASSSVSCACLLASCKPL